MLTTTQGYLDDIYTKSNEKRFLPDFTVGGTLKLNDTNIQEFQFQELSTSEEGVGIGSFPLRKLTVKVYATDTSLYKDKALKADIRHVSGTVFPLGTYKVSDVKKNNKVLVLTCYDSAEKLNFGYFPKINFPTGANVVLADISLQSGVSVQPLTSDFTVTEKLDGYTYREAISIIAGYGGLFARTDRYGKVVLKDYTETGRKIPASGYKTLEQSENPVKIEQLLSNGFVSGSAGYSLKFDNPLITQAQLDKIFAVKKAWSFYSGTLSANGDPSLETGDVIEAITREGKAVKLFVMDIALSYSGALSMVIKSKAKDEARNNSENNKLSLRESVQLQQIQLAIINRALVNKLEAKDLSAVNADIQTLKADKADISELNTIQLQVSRMEADYAIVKDLNAEIANINKALIQKADISVLETLQADITNLGATYATVKVLETYQADISNLLAEKANVTDLQADYATITSLRALETTTGQLLAGKADISVLEAVNANIITLQGDSARFNNLFAGNITASNLKTGLITADSGLIANGAIKDAMILDLSANKISAGTIFTNKVSIQNQDGSLSLAGSLLRMWDDKNRERISLGKDSTGNFTIKVRGVDGQTVMLDETGVKNAGITDGAINDAKVMANANIQGSKLDIKSVINSINADGSTSLKSSKILFDDTGQTLSVAFGELNNYVKNISIEGRNYITNSELIRDFEGWTVWQNRGELTQTDTGVQFNSKDLKSGGIVSPPFEVEAKDYIASFNIAGIGGLKALSYCYLLYSDGKGNQPLSYVLIPTESPIFTRVYLPIKPDRAGRVQLFIGFIPKNLNESFIINRAKYESGVNASEWGPAPEDYSSNFSEIDSKIKSLNTNLGIEQGKINTLISDSTIIKGKVDENISSLSTLPQDLNSFKTTISEQYETADKAAGKYSTKQELSNFTQDLTGFKSTVSSTYATKEDVGNLRAGGRNYLLKSDTYNDSRTDKRVEVSPAFLQQDLRDKYLTLSVDVDVTNVTDKTLYTYPRLGYEISLVYEDNTVQYYGAWKQMAIGGSFKGRHTLTFKLKNLAVKSIASTRLSIQLLADSHRVGRPKMEIGTIQTDWIPAPEDTEGKISELINKASTMEQDLSGFKQTVSSTYETVDNASKTYSTQTAVSQLKQDLDGFMLTAQKTFATDENVKSGYSTLESSLDRFKTEVGNTYSTKKDLDSLQIGGTNLICNSLLTENGDKWLKWNGNEKIEFSSGSVLVEPTSGTPTNFGYRTPQFEVESKPYTVSLNVTGLGNRKLLNYCFIMYTSDSLGSQQLTPVNVDYGATLKRISFLIIPNRAGKVRILFGASTSGISDGFRMNKVKVESGRIATDHSLAPEDQATTAQFSTLEQTLDKFKNTVSENYETKNEVVSKLSTVTQEIDKVKMGLSDYAKTSDLSVYAKTSDVELSLDGITLTLASYAKTSDLNPYAKTTDLNAYAKTTTLSEYVKTADMTLTLDTFKTSLSTTFLTQTTADSTYAKTSVLNSYVKTAEMELRLDDFKLAFTSISGENMIVNGDFRNGFKNWVGVTNFTAGELLNELGDNYLKFSPGQGNAQRVQGFDPYPEYLTLSGYIKPTYLVAKETARIYANITFADNTSKQIQIRFAGGESRHSTQWERFAITEPITKEISSIVVFALNGATNSGSLSVKKLQLQVGRDSSGYSHNYGEFVSSNYIFDGQSARFYGAGLEIYDKVGSTNKIFSVGTNGLLDLKGSITTYQGDKKVSTLGSYELAFYEVPRSSTNNRIGAFQVRGADIGGGKFQHSLYMAVEKGNSLSFGQLGTTSGWEDLFFTADNNSVVFFRNISCSSLQGAQYVSLTAGNSTNWGQLTLNSDGAALKTANYRPIILESINSRIIVQGASTYPSLTFEAGPYRLQFEASGIWAYGPNGRSSKIF